MFRNIFALLNSLYRYRYRYRGIGTEKEHVHFLIQSLPTYSSTNIIQTIKSITFREIFIRHPEVRHQLLGGEFWRKGFYVNTVGRHGDESTIQKYVRLQG